MSRQLDRYLELRAAGATMMTAAAETGIGIAEARLTENDIVRGELKLPAPSTTPQAKENAMARGRKPQQQTSIEVKAPDFEKAVRIFRTDIKPANEKSGEHAQAASTAYKAIKKDCGVNTRAAKFVFQLAGESEEKRNDVLRSVRGLLGAMAIGITDDLVSRAEGEESGTTIIPTAAPERPELATVQ